MTANPGIHVLSDARWAELEPLINEVRPHCKVAHKDLRQTIEAILWRHQNGAKWRSIPGELGPWWKAGRGGRRAVVEGGPWWKAAPTFIRWAHPGVWERLLDWVQKRGVARGMTGRRRPRQCLGPSTAPMRAPTRGRRAGKKAGRGGGARPPRGAWPLSWRLRHQGLRDRGRPWSRRRL